jgi:hypothetical protein
MSTRSKNGREIENEFIIDNNQINAMSGRKEAFQILQRRRNDGYDMLSSWYIKKDDLTEKDISYLEGVMTYDFEEIIFPKQSSFISAHTIITRSELYHRLKDISLNYFPSGYTLIAQEGVTIFDNTYLIEDKDNLKKICPIFTRFVSYEEKQTEAKIKQLEETVKKINSLISNLKFENEQRVKEREIDASLITHSLE